VQLVKEGVSTIFKGSIAMRDFAAGLGVLLLIVLAIAAALGLTWLVQGNDFFLYKTFAPKYEDVRRETFEHSKAFNQGMIQELQNMQFEYIKADEKHQDALASIILHRVADYDIEKLPADLKKFVEELKRERTLSK
jgi:predicted restriction endonuclease